MITPMLKYSFVVHHAGYKDFLKTLKTLGLLHVVEKNAITDDVHKKMDELKELDILIERLKLRAEYCSTTNSTAQPMTGQEIIAIYKEAIVRVEELKAFIESTSSQIKQIEPWGNFSKKSIRELVENGLQITFFTCQSFKYRKEWEENFAIEKIAETTTLCYFVAIAPVGESLREIEADIFQFSDKSLAVLITEKQNLEKELLSVNNTLDLLTTQINSLCQYRESIISEIATANVENNTEIIEEKIMVLEGFIPQAEKDAFEKALVGYDAYWFSEVPTKHDNVPIKLKNGKITTMFETITGLYSMPKYRELDLTPYFAPFFMVFFGVCLSDMAYGLLILFGIGFLKKKLPQDMRQLASLTQFMGISSIVCGFLIGGNFGGIELIELTKHSKPGSFIYSIKDYKIVHIMEFFKDNLIYVACCLGLIQVLFGKFVKGLNVLKQEGVLHSLNPFAWFLFLIGAFTILILNKTGFVAGDLALKCFYGLSVVTGIFILWHPGVNPILGFFQGLWHAYETATGLLGDVLSYIRLFALALAGAILAIVFNDLAVNLSGNTPVVSQLAFILILAIGHGMNIGLAVLSAYIHPIRLTFVEFYKNAGFEGGAKAYNPFK